MRHIILIAIAKKEKKRSGKILLSFINVKCLIGIAITGGIPYIKEKQKETITVVKLMEEVFLFPS